MKTAIKTINISIRSHVWSGVCNSAKDSMMFAAMDSMRHSVRGSIRNTLDDLMKTGIESSMWDSFSELTEELNNE
jgi:hypothetical protein